MQREQVQALILCGLSLTNYALFYLTSILLARTLSVRAFDDYNVAVSSVLVLAAISTLGLDKYALRCLPTLRHNEQWPQSRGFLLFSWRWILIWSVALFALLSLTLEGTLAPRGMNDHVPIVIVALFLPIIALFQFTLEIATAYRGHVQAVAIYRLLFPAVLLLLNVVVWFSPISSSAVAAAVCYGAAWTIAFIAMRSLVKRQVPASVWQATPMRQPTEWICGALPLAASSLMLTMFAQTGVIILELNHPNQAVVSVYAVAFQTGSFVVILATATNRLYSPRISELLARGDFPALNTSAQRRLLMIGPLTAIYMILILVFGRSILAVFGQEFVSAYPALCIIAIGASISTLFSLAPTYLQFTDRSRLVLIAMAGSVGLNLALCFPLSDRFGATGAALAYAIPISLLYIGLRVFTQRDIARYNRENQNR